MELLAVSPPSGPEEEEDEEEEEGEEGTSARIRGETLFR